MCKPSCATPAALGGFQNEHLTVVQGDVLSAADVARTVRGTEAVVSLIGHVKGSPANLQTDGTRHIIAAMRAEGIRRIISLTGGGVPAPPDQPKLGDKIFRFIMKVGFKDMLNDAVAHAELLKASGLDWTVVRGPRLTQDPAAGSYRVGAVGVNASMSLSRADLAAFLLKELETGKHVGQMPFVSK